MSWFEVACMRLISRCQQDWFLLEAFGRSPFLCLSQLLEVACVPWLVAPSSLTIASSNLYDPASVDHISSDGDSLPSSYKELCG